MKYKDLSTYSYLPQYRRDGLLNFGWLDERDVVGGEPDSEIAEILRRHITHRIAQTRGLHLCPFCPAPRNDGMFLERPTGQEEAGVLLGSAEIRVFGAAGEMFAAPDLVVHYVAVHGYAVPEPVAQALRSGPRAGSPDYQRLLRAVTPE